MLDSVVDAIQGQPLLTAAAAAGVAVLVILILLYLRARRAKVAAARTGARAQAAEAILDAAPAGCFTFAHVDGGARCSASLKQSLGLADGSARDFTALLKRFESGDATRLATATQGLRDRGQPFSMTVLHRDKDRRFLVDGKRVAIGAQGVTAEVLWFHDITAQHAAVAEAEAERDGFGDLLDALPDPVWSRGPDLRLAYCNTAYAEAVGRDRAAVLAEGIELPGTALAEASRALARRARAGGETASENQHVVMAGERRLLSLAERPLGPGRSAGYARDLTPVEDLEGILSRHIDAHAEVLESLASGIAIFGPDLCLKFYNQAYMRLLELDEAVLGTEPHLGDILEALRESRRLPEQQDFPAYKQEWIRRFSTLIEPVEELIHMPDGSTLRMTVAPHPFGGVLFSFEDVTDRLALESSYNTLIAVQRETLDNLHEGVAVYGGDGRLKLFNPAFTRIWRLDEEFLAGEPHVREVVPLTRDFFDVSDEDWPEVMDQICVSYTEGEASSGRHERADGSVLKTAQVPLPDGACLITHIDVTDSIRVERALRERNEALETTDRLKSEFIANVSYELRTPLNAIVGFAEILENQFFGELNDRQLEYSRAIVESSQRLLTLINDILDLATIEAGYLRLDLAPVSVRAMLDSIQTLGHERARNKGIAFTVDCPHDIGELTVDERRIKQALFNLVSNAFKFTPEGGRVTVGARREDGEVLMSVVDTGIGIPEEEHDRVFGRFERGGNQGRQSGAGLGLSLVKSLIELHGGWVELESGPDRGTRVTCRLPVEPRLVSSLDDDAAEAILAARQPARNQTSGARPGRDAAAKRGAGGG